MKESAEPVDPAPDSQLLEDKDDSQALSLTDLFDEMDRASFRRSLASRDARSAFAKSGADSD